MLIRYATKAAGTACLSALLAFSGITAAWADGISLVRDAETENMVREYATPIWRAAGLAPSSVRVYLVQDPSINAFVAVGQRLFLNTGLITQVDTPLELSGVIAHETGHMAGGHLIRGQEAMSKMSMPMIASMILGVGAMAAGAGDAGMAVIAGGATVAQRSILAYSRQQEASADQAGASYLQKAGLSGKGMLDLFAKFRDQEALSSTQQDPFIRSHPISEDRLSALEERVEASPFYNKEDSPQRVHELKMIQAKLNGFVDDPDVTFRRYPQSDQSDYARYARAIAFHKNGDIDKSQSEIDLLLQKDGNNPYLWELKGQVFFEAGRVVDSIAPYRKALSLKSDEPQLELELAQALLAVDPSDIGKQGLAIKSAPSTVSAAPKTPQTRTATAQLEIAPTEAQITREALGYLQSSVKRDPENPTTFFQLAIAYGRMNNIGMAELSTAEYYESIGNMRDARGHAGVAQKHLKQGSPEWLRAQDIMQEEG
ncbi:M48 family metalloprotease [Parvibaculum sp.]|uniref:M48 family metalloprotease n=1 Tax=Parvibaculum sp. TaxID=2024848 RepID=UPI002C34BF51|nr:M48 family metalloprotease [Parvibaculum sp.]HUD50195.1 M48 family metalloprotease [Parvibaculum sp.]